MFLISVMKKFGLRKDIIRWVETLVKFENSYITNGGKTTKYLKLERGARQGHLDSLNLYIFVAE